MYTHVSYIYMCMWTYKYLNIIFRILTGVEEWSPEKRDKDVESERGILYMGHFKSDFTCLERRSIRRTTFVREPGIGTGTRG